MLRNDLFSKNITIGLLFFLFPIFFLLFHQPGVAQSKAYLIGSNDILTLTIYAGGELQYKSGNSGLTVSSNGTINTPFVGILRAQGLTTDQLQKMLNFALAKDYFVNPEVDISIKEYHSLHYYISGAVKKPGLYKTTTETTLLELIAKAEGLLPERGNLAYIMRPSTNEGTDKNETGDQSSLKDPIKIDLRKLLDEGDMTVNLALKPGDVIYVPLKASLNLAESKIYVEGEVKRPGIYDYQPGMTAMSATIIAGGFDRFAAPNRTRIIRQKEGNIEIIKINLNQVQEGKIADVELKPGDRVHVPETWL